MAKMNTEQQAPRDLSTVYRAYVVRHNGAPMEYVVVVITIDPDDPGHKNLRQADTVDGVVHGAFLYRGDAERHAEAYNAELRKAGR